MPNENQTTQPTPSPGATCSAIRELADYWKSEATYLRKKATKEKPRSHQLDLKHQAGIYEKCARDLGKIIVPNESNELDNTAN